MRRNALLMLAGISVTLAVPAISGADSVTIGASADNTLYQDAGGALSNGIGVGFFAGKNSTGTIRRGAIKFDVAAALPAGATVTAVALTLNMSNTAGSAVSVDLHRCSADWGEGTSNATSGGGGSGAASTTGDATWIHRSFSSVLWATPGGDFTPTSSATTTVGVVGSYTWASTSQLVSDVQGWLDTPASNAGWIVVGDELANGNVKRFDTRENTTPANRPSLAITYTPAASGVADWSLYD